MISNPQHMVWKECWVNYNSIKKQFKVLIPIRPLEAFMITLIWKVYTNVYKKIRKKYMSSSLTTIIKITFIYLWLVTQRSIKIIQSIWVTWGGKLWNILKICEQNTEEILKTCSITCVLKSKTENTNDSFDHYNKLLLFV